MFCFQCEQTARGQGCTVRGVCGKLSSSSDLQDLILFDLGALSYAAKKKGLTPETKKMLLDGLFTTVTNVNFDDKVLIRVLREIDAAKHALMKGCAGGECPEDVKFKAADSDDGVLKQAQAHSLALIKQQENEDIFSLKSLLKYGLKGMAAYAHHAKVLGVEDDDVYEFIAEALIDIRDDNITAEKLLETVLKCGEVNFKVMGMLDRANTSAYGNPEPTKVRVMPVRGKAILVSGHDLKDLEEILKQTEGKGINVYTHGEMLPCLAYPGLKKYRHLVGNYGGAWQNQQREFPAFPGAIVMTTNCIQDPKGYDGRMFTSGLVAWPGVAHIKDRDFSPAIEKALSMEGFTEDGEERYITVGFGHNTVLNAAEKVIDLVKAGKIRHFFLIGGCDGAKPGRNYYTEFAEQVPDDCVILTLACGKYRFNKLDFGDIEGLPRLMDMGQCNDAYSAIKVAVALSEAFGVPVNELPLSFILSWYEQKAVCILLTLLYLGIKNIRLGPSLPAFVSPNVLNILVEKYNIMPIKTPEEDLKAILG